jgi:hypothetical protein
MTSVNPPNPPNFNGINYNSSFWATSQTGLTYNQIAKQFLKFPVAQGTETVFDLNVQGELTISGTGNGVTFPDDTKQTTAFIEANYAQLNTDNTFLSPYQNTFQGSNLSGPTTGPIKISNVSSGEYGTLYVDPNPTNDLTLYSNQGNSGGLTVRNATNSFTINPATINGSNNWANFLNPINSALGINAGNLNINGNTSPNLNIYTANSTTIFLNLRQDSQNSVYANSFWDGVTGSSHVFQVKNSTSSYSNVFFITLNSITANTNFTSTGAISGTQFTTGSTTITQSPTNNPQIVSFTNTYNGTASPQFYFQMQNTTNTGLFAPLQIINTGINANVPITIPYNGVYPQTSSYIVANIAYVNDGLSYKAPLASPTFTGTPTAPTYTTGSLQQIANVSYVQGYIQSSAPVYVTYTYSIPLSNITTGNATGAQNSFTSSIGDSAQTVTFTSTLSQFILNFNKNIYLSPSTAISSNATLTNTQTNQLFSLTVFSYTATSITFNIIPVQTVAVGVPYSLSFYIAFNKT